MKQEVLEQYRIWRLEALKNPPKFKRNSSRYPDWSTPKRRTKRDGERAILSKERIIEIEQNIALYCIIHESDGHYRDKRSCIDYGYRVLKGCQEGQGTNNLIHCLKSQLNLYR